MLDRVSVKGKPVILRDLGPAIGRRHPWSLMRKTIDPPARDAR